MKIIVSTVIVLIIFLSVSSPGILGGDTPSPQALNVNFSGSVHNVQFDPVSEVLSDILGQALNSQEHVCMNLTPQEVQSLNMFSIHYGDINAEQSGETCNSQFITVNQQNMFLPDATRLSFTSLLHISYYEFPDTIQGKILDIMANREVNRLEKKDGELPFTAADITLINKHKVIREVRNNNQSHSQGRISPFTSITCILTARLPSGLVSLEYDENNNQRTNRINKTIVCQTPASALMTIWQHHIKPDNAAPKFCLNIDDAWLSSHNLVPASDSMGCQEQSLTWKNSPDVHDPDNQITLEIRRNFIPFFPFPSPGGLYPGAPGMMGAPGYPMNPPIPGMLNSPSLLGNNPPLFPGPMSGASSMPGTFGQNPNFMQSGAMSGASSGANQFGSAISPGFPPSAMGVPGSFGPNQTGWGMNNNPFSTAPTMLPSQAHITGTPTRIGNVLAFLYTDPGFGMLQINKAKLIIVLPGREALVVKIASQNLTMAQVSTLIKAIAEYQIQHNIPHK